MTYLGSFRRRPGPSPPKPPSPAPSALFLPQQPPQIPLVPQQDHERDRAQTQHGRARRPDHRDHQVQLALSLGMDKRFLIETPLMWIDKAETWALAQSLGEKSGTPNGGEALVELVIEHTHTCYLGDRVHRHAWGYGCGQCPACELRAKGYDKYRASSRPER